MRDLVTRLSSQLRRITILGPQEHPLRSRPQSRERLIRLKRRRRVREQRSVPEIGAALVQDVHPLPGVEVQRRPRLVLAEDHDLIARLELLLDRDC